MEPQTKFSQEQFQIDLNSVRDGNRVVALLGFRRPQRVPFIGEAALAIDEDGYRYDAEVEAVLPDSRVYLRLKWESRASIPPTFPLTYQPARFWTLNAVETQ